MASALVELCLSEADNDFQRLLQAEAERAARVAGLRLVVHFTGHDLPAQLHKLGERIGSPDRPAALLVLAVRDQGLARVARDAVRAGVSFVYLNRTEDDIEGLRKELPARVTVSAVCADELATGRIQGRQFKRLLPGPGKVLYVQGSRRSLAARDRTAGMQEAVAGAPFQVVPIEAGWNAAEAREAAARWLGVALRAGMSIDLVGCHNDQIALGTLDALAAAARELGRPEVARVPVCGCDGTPTVGQQLVREGRLAATVRLPVSSGPAIERVARLLSGGEPLPALVQLEPKSFPEETALAPRRP